MLGRSGVDVVVEWRDVVRGVERCCEGSGEDVAEEWSGHCGVVKRCCMGSGEML